MKKAQESRDSSGSRDRYDPPHNLRGKHCILACFPLKLISKRRNNAEYLVDSNNTYICTVVMKTPPSLHSMQIK